MTCRGAFFERERTRDSAARRSMLGVHPLGFVQKDRRRPVNRQAADGKREQNRHVQPVREPHERVMFDDDKTLAGVVVDGVAGLLGCWVAGYILSSFRNFAIQ